MPSLGSGVRVGAYEIVSLLGAGGMGEVYRARDAKLGRDVAIKVLPTSLTNDPDRLARFSREAQVLAALNHLNIAAIYHVEETADGPAIVMELVDGETLADRIARGPIPLDEALPIAKQIAEALEAAHEQGIIRRDLKPANIKLTPNGTVKVLDFGLAKLHDAGSGIGDPGSAGAALSMSPTITSPALMTGIGVLLGTAAYMSPSRRRADRPTNAATPGPSGVCSTRCSPGSARFQETTSQTYLRRFCAASPIGTRSRRRRLLAFDASCTVVLGKTRRAGSQRSKPYVSKSRSR